METNSILSTMYLVSTGIFPWYFIVMAQVLALTFYIPRYLNTVLRIFNHF